MEIFISTDPIDVNERSNHACPRINVCQLPNRIPARMSPEDWVMLPESMSLACRRHSLWRLRRTRLDILYRGYEREVEMNSERMVESSV